MSGPIEISNGRETVKIYATTVRGKPIHQIAYYRAGRRERRSFNDLGEARREAKLSEAVWRQRPPPRFELRIAGHHKRKDALRVFPSKRT